jgi:hypothetical protein
MRGTAIAVCLVVAWGCGGGKAERGGAQAAKPAKAGSGTQKGGCSGTLTGPVPGSFTCTVMANFYYEGSEIVGGRHNALVTVLSNPYDPTHTRPKGVKNVGGNVEIQGEPKPGSWGKADVGRGTIFSVILDDGRMFDRIKDLSLTLSNASVARDSDVLGVKSRLYRVNGRLETTLTDEAGAEARVTASF